MSEETTPSLMRRGVRKLRARVGEVAELRSRVAELSNDVEMLRQRVSALEEELLDARSQGRRIAEISDLVTGLLASEASRRGTEFQRIVARYVDE